MDSVVNAITALGVQVHHIPGGCTGLIQPVDVGINRPLKSKIRSMWEEWMIEEGIGYGITRPPDRQRMAAWCISALESLNEDMIKNAWRHPEFGWFDAEEQGNVAAVDGQNMDQPELVLDDDHGGGEPLDGERIELGVGCDDLFEILNLRQNSILNHKSG
jgi:hypothetical protein